MSEELAQTKEELKEKISKQPFQKGITPPQNICGDCAAYKTPFCIFSDQQRYITKKDVACSSFFPDRHINRKKLKVKKVMKRLGKR